MPDAKMSSPEGKERNRATGRRRRLVHAPKAAKASAQAGNAKAATAVPAFVAIADLQHKTFHAAASGVDAINACIDMAANTIFKTIQKKTVDVSDIRSSLSTLANNENVERYLKSLEDKGVDAMLSHVRGQRTVKKDLQAPIFARYKVQFTDVYAYVYFAAFANAMGRWLFQYISDNYKYDNRGKEVTAELVDDFVKSRVLRDFFRSLDIVPTALAPTFDAALFVRGRKPVMFEYDSEMMSGELAFERHRPVLQPGDVLYPKDGYRAEGIMVIDKPGEWISPLVTGNGHAVLPPWVLELGMRNGHSFSSLLSVYVAPDIFSAVIYPLSEQKNMRLDKHGYVVSCLAADHKGHEFRLTPSHVAYEDIVHYNNFTPDALFLDYKPTSKATSKAKPPKRPSAKQ